MRPESTGSACSTKNRGFCTNKCNNYNVKFRNLAVIRTSSIPNPAIEKNAYIPFKSGIEVNANTRSTHLSKLITSNNKILRILQNKPYRFTVKDLYIAYNTLPVPQLHIQQLLLLVHKCIYHKSICYLRYFWIIFMKIRLSTLTTQDKKTIFIRIVFTQLLVKGLLNSMVPHYGMSSLNTSKISSLLKS